MDAVTIKEAKDNLERLVQRVNADAEPTLICGEGDEKAVILSLDEFNSWQDTIHLLSSPSNAKHLRRSIAEANAGKVTERKLIEP